VEIDAYALFNKKISPDYDDIVGIWPVFYDVNLGIFMMSKSTVTGTIELIKVIVAFLHCCSFIGMNCRCNAASDKVAGKHVAVLLSPVRTLAAVYFHINGHRDLTVPEVDRGPFYAGLYIAVACIVVILQIVVETIKSFPLLPHMDKKQSLYKIT
jgi:hypothetical protein